MKNHYYFQDLPAWAIAVIICLFLLLTACGGGSSFPDEDPTKSVPQVDCVKTPELCK